jgi:hypothetical protein
MTASATELHGVIHGKTIELENDAGLPDGQQVTVTVHPVNGTQPRLAPGEGIRRSAGGWADDPAGLDEFLESNRQQRKATRGPIEDAP